MPSTCHQTKSEEKEAKRRELEEYAQAYFKYSKLFQDQADAMRHDPIEMKAAHARITAESLEVQRQSPLTLPSVEQALNLMGEYAQWCEIEPKTFDELSRRTLFLGNSTHEFFSRVRTSFAASFYTQMMVNVVLQAPERPRSDFMTVITRGAQLL
jgi:hypothetical protein